MSQIEIRILKQGTETKKVISVSFFTMRDAYREFFKYINRLENLLKVATNVRPEFSIRVYTDDSGKDIALQLAEPYDHVSVYHYNFEAFREEIGHIGTFGTLPRFLPMFEKDLEIVWVSDIDVPDKWFDILPLEEFNYVTHVCYENKQYGRTWSIIASSMVSRIQFPKQLLTKFINNLVDNSFSEMVDNLNSDNSRRKKPYSRVPYGIDEFFLNTSIYNYLIRHNSIVSIKKDYFIGMNQFLGYSGKLTAAEKKTIQLYYDDISNRQIVSDIKKILVKYKDWIMDSKLCYHDTFKLLNSFKNSFSKRYVLEGKELE